jgi:hypothetical protein
MRRLTCLPSATPAIAPRGEGVPVAHDRGLPDWTRHRSARRLGHPGDKANGLGPVSLNRRNRQT